jgi:hypothetical protein
LISTLGSSVTTDFPENKVADYVQIGETIPRENIHQAVLGPPYTLINLPGATASSSCLLNYKVAELSIELFGKESRYFGKPPPANTCPL